MSNNAIGTSTRTTLGLNQTAPGTITSYTVDVTVGGFTVPTRVIDGTDAGETITADNVTTYVFGMAGNDILDLRDSSAIGVGGLGADTFIVGGGPSLITMGAGQALDFSAAEGDKIDLSNVANSFSDVTVSVNENNSYGTVTVAGKVYNVAGLDVRLDTSNIITATNTGTLNTGTPIGGTTTPTTPSAATAGPDNINGTSGNDDFNGLGGNDTIYGNQGADVISGGSGNDTLYGGQGNDLLNGNEENDLVLGNKDQDTVYGGKGDDSVYGGQGDDVVNGNLGTDSVYGDVGNDTVYGGQGDDFVFGGAGSDYIYGDKGSDNLSGGDGVDYFHFLADHGADTVTDFTAGVDKLAFSSSLFADASAVVNAFSNGVITDAGGSVHLTGITSLSASDIIIL